MMRRIRAVRGQRRVESDNIGLFGNGLELHETFFAGFGAERVAQKDRTTQSLDSCHYFCAYVPHADHSYSEASHLKHFLLLQS